MTIGSRGTSRPPSQEPGIRIAAVLLCAGIVLSLLGCISLIILAIAVPNGQMVLMGIPSLIVFGGTCGGLLALLAGVVQAVTRCRSGRPQAENTHRHFQSGWLDTALTWGVFFFFLGLVCFIWMNA